MKQLYTKQETSFNIHSVESVDVNTLLNKNPLEVYEDDENHIFARYGSVEKGYIVWIDKTKLKIRYVVDYKTLCEKSVEVKVWQSENLPRSGMTSHVFHNILLKEFKCIASVFDLTKDSVSFWMRQLTMGHMNDYWVGLYDEDIWYIDWCDPESDFDAWCDDAYPECLLSTDCDKQKYRFLISNHKF